MIRQVLFWLVAWYRPDPPILLQDQFSDAGCAAANETTRRKSGSGSGSGQSLHCVTSGLSQHRDVAPKTTNTTHPVPWSPATSPQLELLTYVLTEVLDEKFTQLLLQLDAINSTAAKGKQMRKQQVRTFDMSVLCSRRAVSPCDSFRSVPFLVAGVAVESNL